MLNRTFVNSITASSQVQCKLMMDCISWSVVVLCSTFAVFPLARGQEKMEKLPGFLQFNFTFAIGIQIKVKECPLLGTLWQGVKFQVVWTCSAVIKLECENIYDVFWASPNNEVSNMQVEKFRCPQQFFLRCIPSLKTAPNLSAGCLDTGDGWLVSNM